MAEKFNEENENIIKVFYEETGEEISFDHLDTVEMDGILYYVVAEHTDDEAEESDVYVMTMVKDENGEEFLEIVEDQNILDNVFEEFKSLFGEEYDFLD